jgi:ketosteroid isomerase-like protein
MQLLASIRVLSPIFEALQNSRKMKNKDILSKFYSSFSEGNAKGMVECYHKNVVFQDPAFGKLEGNKAKKMWEMLLSNKKTTIKVSYSNIQTSNEKASADWIAEYVYGKRKVINKVSAKFKFKEGKIIAHIDHFNLWKWSIQALGPIGYLLGWTPFMKAKIQKKVNQKLANYIAKTKT